MNWPGFVGLFQAAEMARKMRRMERTSSDDEMSSSDDDEDMCNHSGGKIKCLGYWEDGRPDWGQCDFQICAGCNPTGMCAGCAKVKMGLMRNANKWRIYRKELCVRCAIGNTRR